MSRTPIINSILKTRKNQIADFAEPQADRYSTGFVIRRKPKFGQEQKMDSQDRKIAASITDFILNCGDTATWDGDEFDEFIRKIVDDSLTFDQMTFECIVTAEANWYGFRPSMLRRSGWLNRTSTVNTTTRILTALWWMTAKTGVPRLTAIIQPTFRCTKQPR